MSAGNKKDKDFEFIKEKVVPKKSKKIKKFLKPFIMTVILAIIFGVVAAITFSITEPEFYDYLHRGREERKSITFPSEYPEDNLGQFEEDNEGLKVVRPGSSDGINQNETPNNTENETSNNIEDESVPIIKEIEAKAKDLVTIYEDIRKIADEASKSIVKIDSIKDGRDLFGNPIEIRKPTSGVVIADLNGELAILASFDRIISASRLQLVFSDQVMVDAKLLDYDEELNLAIINVMIEDIPTIYYHNIEVAQLGESYSTNVGTPVIALGNPNGYYGSLEIGHITSRVSYISTIDNRIELFNTSIIDNENSDGVIVNFEGKIIGVITRMQDDDVNTNVNTAIGISRLKPILQKLANNEPRTYMGIVVYELTDAAKEIYDVKRGVYIHEVVAESPAFDDGLKSGDIILEINGQEVFNINSYHDILNDNMPGDKVTVKIKRTSAHNREMKYEITLADKK